jgi:hypothetical protein
MFSTKIYIIFTVMVVLCESIKSQTDCNNDYGIKNTMVHVNQSKNARGAALKGNCLNSFVCCIRDTQSPPNLTENSFINKRIFLKLVGDTV